MHAAGKWIFLLGLCCKESPYVRKWYMTDIVLIFSKTNRFPLMSRNNNYWRVMLSAHFVLAKSLVILKAITKRICFHVQCQLASLARKRVKFACICQKPTTGLQNDFSSFRWIFVIFACLSFSSFFVFLHLFNSFLFLFLYSLSILNTISFLFLVISIVRPQSGFYRFFLQFLSNPSSETSDRKLGNYIFCIWEAQLEMHTLDRLFILTTFWKEHSAHLVLLALLQCGI